MENIPVVIKTISTQKTVIESKVQSHYALDKQCDNQIKRNNKHGGR